MRVPSQVPVRLRWRQAVQSEPLLAAALVVFAIGVRYVGRSYVSVDFIAFTQPWGHFIESHGGFRALRYDFADYNVPYLYLLAGLTYLPVSLLPAVKVVSVCFDAILAYFTFRLVGLRYPGWRVPWLAAMVVLLLPTVLTNSATWGQCDSIYASLSLAGLYYLLRDRPWLGCALFGAAYAFKQQTVFLFPLLMVLVLSRRVPWRALLAIPAVFLALDIPALLVGRPLGDLLTIYVRQTSTYHDLTANAPTVYAFVPVPSHAEFITKLGVMFAAGAFLLLTYALLASRVVLTTSRVILLATVCVIMAPFLLPAMHERYFYLADVLTVITAFHLPRRLWYLPLPVQAASFLSYLPPLFTIPGPVDLRILATLVLAAWLVSTYELLSGAIARDGRPDGPPLISLQERTAADDLTDGRVPDRPDPGGTDTAPASNGLIAAIPAPRSG